MTSRASKSSSSTPSKSPSPGTASFLELPREIRDSIYTRVLIAPHPLYLSQDPGSGVETFAPERRTRWVALLYTNRQIHHEASETLYRVNKFHLVDITKEQTSLLQSFIRCIGPRNAASLSYICINFPATESVDGQPGKVKIRDDSLQILQLLRDTCTRLLTLAMIVHSKNRGVFNETDDIIQETLLLVNAQFVAIPLLKNIVVRIAVHDGVPTTPAKNAMERLGWVVSSDNGMRR